MVRFEVNDDNFELTPTVSFAWRRLHVFLLGVLTATVDRLLLLRLARLITLVLVL